MLGGYLTFIYFLITSGSVFFLNKKYMGIQTTLASGFMKIFRIKDPSGSGKFFLKIFRIKESLVPGFFKQAWQRTGSCIEGYWTGY